MCGRFSLSITPEVLAKLFELDETPDLDPRFNIAPNQAVAAILRGREEARRTLRLLRWGLIPFWAKDPGLGARMINTRSETVAEKPAFRQAFAQQRCLVPATGFFEWQEREQDKQPFFIRMRDESCFALAGLWQRWEGQDHRKGEVIESCSLLTTTANDLIRPIHHRMPVILRPEDHDLWLDPAVKDKEQLQHLLLPFEAAALEAYPVSRRVNRPDHDAPDCIEPMGDPGDERSGREQSGSDPPGSDPPADGGQPDLF